MKLILFFLAITFGYLVSAQSPFEFSQALEKGERLGLYENENDDEFRLGVSFESQKGIFSEFSLLFDSDFANDYTTYTLRNFFVIDFNLSYSLGPFDFLLSIENIFNFNSHELTLEPAYILDQNLTYLTGYEHEASSAFVTGISFTF